MHLLSGSDAVIVPRKKKKKEHTLYDVHFDGSGGIKYYSDHPQRNTGLGFTCDELIVDVVVAMNKAKFKTYSSCQDTSESNTGRSDFAVPHAFIGFYHSDINETVKFCMFMRKSLGRLSGWNLDIEFNRYMIHAHPTASFYFILDLIPFIEDTLGKYK